MNRRGFLRGVAAGSLMTVMGVADRLKGRDPGFHDWVEDDLTVVETEVYSSEYGVIDVVKQRDMSAQIRQRIEAMKRDYLNA